VSLRFLIVDDDCEFRRVLRYHLEVEWPDAAISEYQPAAAGQFSAGFALGGMSLVLLGHPIGAEQPAELTWLRTLCRRPDCPPVVVFARDGDELLAVDALRAGAANYFPKRKTTHRRLVEALRAAMQCVAGPVRTALQPVAASKLQGLRRHRFVAELHRSDLTTVYLAEAELDAERVVFKVLKHVPDVGGSQLFDRFLQEYEAIAGVSHPHIVRILDLGIADDHAYIAMEYLSNGNLARRVRNGLPRASVLEILEQIASALAAIHAIGILHRDLKPANIMFRDDESLALIDFGLAKHMRLEAAITGTGQIFGTPYYMSPEQGHADPADERSDIYSLGCILHEMLTGRRPFTASSPMAVIYQHANAPRPRLEGPLRAWQPTLERMLAVDPARRYQSAQALLEDLRMQRGALAG
jgi:DNA-binding NarL/FixJ family response regulator